MILYIDCYGDIAETIKNKIKMKEEINLAEETVEFVRVRMAEILGEDPQNREQLKLNMKWVKEQIFHLFYDYQVRRFWPHVAARTALMLGYDKRAINKMLEKNRRKAEKEKSSR